MTDLSNIRDFAQFAESVVNSGAMREMNASIAGGITESFKAQRRENILAEVQTVSDIEKIDDKGWSLAGQSVKAKALEKLAKL